MIGFRADVNRKGRSWENRQIRIHGAAFGARRAIQSGSDHDPLYFKAEQIDQAVPDDDRDVRFTGLILGQLLGLVGIRILSRALDQMFPSERNPHIIEKEQSIRPQQPYCCGSGRQIDIDRIAIIEIDDIKSLSIPGEPNQVEQVCS